MTEAELQAIKARLAAATPGPWGSGELRNPWTMSTDVGQVFAVGPVHLMKWNGQNEAREKAERDAEFIANAPTDIAALIEEVERLWRP